MTGHKEQDAAAGGPEFRALILDDGAKVMASIAVFKAKLGYQYYAYLRFKTGGKNVKRYVGNVSADSRAESLQIGWELVRQRKVVEAAGWRWERAIRSRGSAKSVG